MRSRAAVISARVRGEVQEPYGAGVGDMRQA